MKRTLALHAACVVLLAMAPEARAQELLWSKYSTTTLDYLGFRHRIVPDLTGDQLHDVVVGAMGSDCSSTDNGRVVGCGGNSGAVTFDRCGPDKELFGSGGIDWVSDVDGDGVTDLLVGVPVYREPTLGSDTGRVVLLSGADGSDLWSLVGEGPGDRFGAPVRRVGDLDGDGYDEFITSAVAYYNSQGKVYVVSSRDGTVLRTHTGTRASEELGYGLSRLEDSDGDGVADYSIGTQLRNFLGQGRIDVHSGASGALLWSKEGETLEGIGTFISEAGDWNQDGHADLMTYAFIDDGALRIYSPATDELLFEFVHQQTSGHFADEWGKSFCRVGDRDGDGVEDYAIGAQFDSHVGVSAGRVELVSGRTFRVLYDFYPDYPAGGFGQRVDSGGDVDGDGIFDLVVSAPYERPTQPKGGQVFVYALNDLYLQAEPLEPLVGDTVVVDLRGGPPGLFGLVVLTDVSGTPAFETLLLAPFDANGELQLTADVQSSCSGLDFTIRAWSQNRRGRGPAMDSIDVTVSVQ